MQSLAHELGHNLNFGHDFTADKTIPRLDSKGRPCSGIGSIMEYSKGDQGDKRQWSTCSVEDFTALVNQFPDCLKAINPLKPPTEVPSPPLTSHECDLTKIKPGLNGYEYTNYYGRFTIRGHSQMGLFEEERGG